MTSWSASGSGGPPASATGFGSANTIVTVLRLSRTATVVLSTAPHMPQCPKASGFSSPQVAHSRSPAAAVSAALWPAPGRASTETSR